MSHDGSGSNRHSKDGKLLSESILMRNCHSYGSMNGNS